MPVAAGTPRRGTNRCGNWPCSTSRFGIDLGLREFAATSDGAIGEAQQFYRALEEKLAIAQRTNKKDRVKAIHAKIANRRKNFQHKLGTQTRLVQAYGATALTT